MILDELANYSFKRVQKAKETVSLDEIKSKAYDLKKGDFSFEKTLLKPQMSFICEIKKASPSKGVIDPVFDYMSIAQDYESIGADCISCLTEPKWFLGSDEIFKKVHNKVSLPMLRKDFTVDEYQIYEAKLMGASSILLICSILDVKQLEKYLSICDELGLSALVETHNEEEIKTAIDIGARIIGVNNRNLKNFTVDFSNAQKMRELVPEDKIFVAESGIKTPEDIKILNNIGVDAVLIGETLMRAKNRNAVMKSFKEACL